MNKKQITEILAKHKYIFIGEIHGTKEIPTITYKLIKSIFKNNKIIFCLEMPKQAERSLYEYFDDKIKKKILLKSFYLRDATFDKRVTSYNLSLYKKLQRKGVIFKGLENYYINSVDERDESMANRFLEIINNYDADRYIVYIGGFHTIEKSRKIMGFNINPIKIYLPQRIIKKILTIQFNNSNKEEIIFYKKTNTINYKIPLDILFNKKHASLIYKKQAFLKIKTNPQSKKQHSR